VGALEAKELSLFSKWTMERCEWFTAEGSKPDT
jgi:hypothetical protein